MANVNMSDKWPWSEMKEVTVDGQQMVRIPRIYVKNCVLKDGECKGKTAYFIAQRHLAGFHVHPAFMNYGKAAKALDLSCYEASHDAKDNRKPASVSTTNFWQGINRNDAIAACDKRNVDGGTDEQHGWHCWDIYCQHLLARLMLIEYGGTNFAFQEDGTDYVYRGIHQPAGNPISPTWLPGLSGIGNKMYIYDNNGSMSMIATGLRCPGNGWPTSFSMLKGQSFDLGDVFVADAVTSTKTNGICSDWQRLAQNDVMETGYFTGFRGGDTDPADAYGMFAISQETHGDFSGHGSPSAVSGSASGGWLRFRLAHFVA